MKKILIITTLVLCGAVVFGQQARPRLVLVIPPFDSRRSQLDAAVLENLQDYMINAFIKTERFDVPDRNALALLFEEHKFQLSDLSDDTLDVNTAGGQAAAELEFITQRDARGKMEGFVNGIVKRINARDHIAQAKPEPVPEPAPVEEPKRAPRSRYPNGLNYSTEAKVGYGYLNLLGGLGSFIMGDWKGGLLVGGLQAVGITMIVVDAPRRTSHPEKVGTGAMERSVTQYEETGGGPAFYIGLALELCGVIYGYFRPFQYDKARAYRVSAKNPWQDNPLEHIGVVLLPDGKGVSAVNLSYTLSF